MSTHPPVSTDQMTELVTFARQEGRRWKDVLLHEFWFRGLPVRGFPLLYGLRNTHGPSWLVQFRLPKEPK